MDLKELGYKYVGSIHLLKIIQSGFERGRLNLGLILRARFTVAGARGSESKCGGSYQ
jgi:hypothetical protein